MEKAIVVYGSGDQEYMPRGQKGKQPPVMAPDTDLKSRSSQRAQVEMKVVCSGKLS